MSDGWNSPHQIVFGTMSMFAFRMCQQLVEKGVLSKEEAAEILTSTASDLRSGTEDGPGEPVGEASARVFEKLAAWILGHGRTQ